MEELTLIAALLGAIFIFLVIGAPVAWALTGISLTFAFIIWGPKAVDLIVKNVLNVGMTSVFICIPLYSFIGLSLRYSGIIEDLYDMFHKWLGRVPGGLAIGTMLICIVFAAIAAGSGATIVLMGLVAMPSMLKRGYDNKLIMGSISAGAVLGIVIPPSIPMVLLALFARLSLGQLFFAGVIPGVICGIFHCTYILFRCAINPKFAPPIPIDERVDWKGKIESLRAVILPVMLILSVLGGIWTGIWTPTEASGIGALGACLILIVKRKISWKLMTVSLATTLKVTVMVFWILVGAFCFVNIYSYLGAVDLMHSFLTSVSDNQYVALAMMMAIMFLSGMIMDDYALIILLAPLFFPLVRDFGWDPLWFGIVFILNIQMAYLTPPYGFNLFYMRAITPKTVSMVEIYRSVIPFVAVQASALILAIFCPFLVTWLPSLMI